VAGDHVDGATGTLAYCLATKAFETSRYCIESLSEPIDTPLPPSFRVNAPVIKSTPFSSKAGAAEIESDAKDGVETAASANVVRLTDKRSKTIFDKTYPHITRLNFTS